MLRLNELSPAPGSKHSKKRLGRGIGSGFGKTSGKGHKGQKARSGGTVRVGFEGGQMPLQRRLPKYGFTSRKSFVTDEVTLHELDKVEGNEITLNSLKAAGLISSKIAYVKVIKSGEIKRAVNVKGIRVTKGAKALIEAAGGTVEE